MVWRPALALAFALGLASGPAHADEPMTGQQIKNLAPGTFKAVVRGRFQITVVLNRNGVVVGKVSGYEDRGRWSVRDDQLCIVMPAWTKGRLECSTVVADGDWYRSRNVMFRPL